MVKCMQCVFLSLLTNRPYLQLALLTPIIQRHAYVNPPPFNIAHHPQIMLPSQEDPEGCSLWIQSEGKRDEDYSLPPKSLIAVRSLNGRSIVQEYTNLSNAKLNAKVRYILTDLDRDPDSDDNDFGAKITCTFWPRGYKRESQTISHLPFCITVNKYGKHSIITPSILNQLPSPEEEEKAEEKEREEENSRLLSKACKQVTTPRSKNFQLAGSSRHTGGWFVW